jgi:uncharacterized membrane protein
MNAENFFSNVPLLAGTALLLSASLMLVFPPRNVNGLYGYRTPGSMKTPERWKFAQKFAAQRMLESATMLLLTGLICHFASWPAKTVSWIAFVEIPIAIIYLIWRTETALKRNFPK